MNLIAIFSFLVILYEISSSTISHTIQCQPANITGFYWIKIFVNLYTDLKFLVSFNCFCTVVQPPIEGLKTCPLAVEKFENLYGGSTCNLCGVLIGMHRYDFLPDIGEPIISG